MSTPNRPATPDTQIDIAELTRLVEALERDLDGVRRGSKDIQALRDEVDALRRVLAVPAEHGELSSRLRSLHTVVEEARDEVVTDAMSLADYAVRIGRILGL